MSANLSFLAVDLGASSGRVMDCRWDGARFELQELHRFPNAGVRVGESLHWDALRIWSEIQVGLMKFRALRSEIPTGIGVDAWGVDFALLDERDRLIGNPHHYRDARTKGMPEQVSSAMSARDLFQADRRADDGDQHRISTGQHGCHAGWPALTRTHCS